ncbi:unnamed protein product [Acanthosepion pharaonis]|uniref:Uncharacterized protein n=1 Tax=Acanthosepion pharaonis TaxID=158019 RepID=A0A812CXX2_ACAPH|nr:unnamed protein product [Sepia pharaonis]
MARHILSILFSFFFSFFYLSFYFSQSLFHYVLFSAARPLYLCLFFSFSFFQTTFSVYLSKISGSFFSISLLNSLFEHNFYLFLSLYLCLFLFVSFSFFLIIISLSFDFRILNIFFLFLSILSFYEAHNIYISHFELNSFSLSISPFSQDYLYQNDIYKRKGCFNFGFSCRKGTKNIHPA